MKIGIAISGGGYRATSFGLGTFSYLNHIQFENKPLLQHTIALSTVSGGSIVGLTYAQWTKAGLHFDDYFKWLYDRVTTFDLVTDAVDKYVADSKKNSLIEGFSSSYGDNFLTHRKFWSIQPNYNEGKYDTHLLYYSINSTDFNTGTPFRFVAQQSNWSEYLVRNGLTTKNRKNETTSSMDPFIVGNSFFRLDKDIQKIPLNVALASSSCFPGGFEPIILRMEDHLEKRNGLHEEVALMDGGIVDNQGGDAIVDFQKKIPLDFVFVVDSASPNITKYDQSHPTKIPFIGDCNIKFLTQWTYILTGVFALALILSLCSNTLFTLLFTVLTTIFAVLTFVSLKLKNTLNKTVVDKGLNELTLKPLNHLTPNTIKQLLFNRVESLELLIGSVFMKHIRRLNMENLFEVNTLKRKILYNTLYQNKILSENETFLKLNISQKGIFKKYIKKVQDEILKEMILNGDVHEKEIVDEKILQKIQSSEAFEKRLNEILGGIPEISKRAFEMGTTLWVSKNEEGKNIVKDVIVTGQISTCVNIINNEEIKNNYIDIHNQAIADWEKFKKNPYWLFDKFLENPNDVNAIFKAEQIKQDAYYNKEINI